MADMAEGQTERLQGLYITGEVLHSMRPDTITELELSVKALGLNLQLIYGRETHEQQATLPEIVTLSQPDQDTVLTRYDLRRLAKEHGYEAQIGERVFWALGASDFYTINPLVEESRRINRHPHTADQGVSLAWLRIVTPRLKPGAIRDIGPVSVGFLQAVSEHGSDKAAQS